VLGLQACTTTLVALDFDKHPPGQWTPWSRQKSSRNFPPALLWFAIPPPMGSSDLCSVPLNLIFFSQVTSLHPAPSHGQPEAWPTHLHQGSIQHDWLPEASEKCTPSPPGATGPGWDGCGGRKGLLSRWAGPWKIPILLVLGKDFFLFQHHPLSHSTSPLFAMGFFFWDTVSQTICLASNCDPPDLCLLSR
jgi:hypothetical protein